MKHLLFLPLAFALAGCGGPSQPAFPELHPVRGVVKRGGAAVSGGVVKFTPEPATPDFLVNGEIGADGSFTLSTVRTTDTAGERKPGAPAGKYKVTYLPPAGDQTVGPTPQPVTLPAPVTLPSADVVIELPKR